MGDKVNTINLTFTKKLSRRVWQIKVDTQKIDGFGLETFEIVIVTFLIDDKVRRLQFFEKMFMLLNINMDIVLGILFSP